MSRKRMFMFARYSKILPELQTKLLTHIKTVDPNMQFTSIIINKFELGDRTGRHTDGSLLPLHVSQYPDEHALYSVISADLEHPSSA